MKVYLSEEEWNLIKQRRAETAAALKEEEFRMSVAETAAQFFRYLDQAGMNPSFSEFVNGFGYEEKDGKRVYDLVIQIREVLWK